VHATHATHPSQHTESTAQMPTISAMSALALSVPPPGFHAVPSRVPIPPSSVRRAFIASLRPEPPPRIVRPWFIVGVSALVVLAIGACAIAYLAFPSLFH
jgi:hypothetical protein